MTNELIEIISKEAVLFESFLKLLEEQKAMLVENNLEGLHEVTQRQQQKVLESQMLDRERVQLVERIKQANEIEGDLTVARLLELVDQTQADRLVQLKELILNLNKKIHEVRNTNAMLLNQSREFIAKTMSALSRITNPDVTYTASHASATNGGSVVVDRRA